MATMDEFSLLGRQAPECSQSTLLCRSIERFRSSSDFLTPCGESWRGLSNRSNRGTSATGANCRFAKASSPQKIKLKGAPGPSLAVAQNRGFCHDLRHGRNPICESEWLHVRGLASTRIDRPVG